MNKNLFLWLATGILAYAGKAQTLTYSNFSTVLSVVQPIRVADNTSYNTAINTTIGNGVTWNAAALTPANGYPVINMGYYNPNTTPHQSTYPNSNYAQYDPALTSVLEYAFYNISADSVCDVGSYAPSTAHETYQDPDKRLVFPFSYGQSFTDNYAKTNYSNSTTISSFQTGSRTVDFNGFGTLVLPQGSFNNVALLTEVRTNSLGPNSNTYTWIDISNGKTLMRYHSNNGSITVVYTNEVPSGIEKNSNTSLISFYPNPAMDKITFKLPEAEFYGTTLVIYAATGQPVARITLKSEFTEIDLGPFAKGIYFYKIEGPGHTGKFIKD